MRDEKVPDSWSILGLRGCADQKATVSGALAASRSLDLSGDELVAQVGSLAHLAGVLVVNLICLAILCLMLWCGAPALRNGDAGWQNRECWSVSRVSTHSGDQLGR